MNEMLKILMALVLFLGVFLSMGDCGELFSAHGAIASSTEGCLQTGEAQDQEHNDSHCPVHCGHHAAISLNPIVILMDELLNENAVIYSFNYKRPFLESFKRPPLAA